MVAIQLKEEYELLAKIASGDHFAFKVIFESYQNKLYTFSFRILQNEVLAEEVVQETMLKLWKMGEGLTNIHNLDSYLKTSARNLSIDILRKKEHQHKIEADLAIGWQDTHNETEEQILLNDTRKIWNEAVNLLPPQQKLAYQLCHLEGLKYEEAARELNVSPETVKFYMKLALRFLRNYISSHTDIVAILIIFRLL